MLKGNAGSRLIYVPRLDLGKGKNPKSSRGNPMDAKGRVHEEKVEEQIPRKRVSL